MKLIAEIGTCWERGNRDSLFAAVQAAENCGADIVKVQFICPVCLAARRGITPEKLMPWDMRPHFEWLTSQVKKHCTVKLGVSIFCVHGRDAIHKAAPKGVIEFVKTATQEFQWADLASAVNNVSIARGMDLYVSVPPDGTLVVGNYGSTKPITWMYCVPEYPVVQNLLGLGEIYEEERMARMVRRLPGKHGISDHTAGIELAANMLKIFPTMDAWEKHFCYDESLRGKTPDAGTWSLSQEDFTRMARSIHGG